MNFANVLERPQICGSFAAYSSADLASAYRESIAAGEQKQYAILAEVWCRSPEKREEFWALYREGGNPGGQH